MPPSTPANPFVVGPAIYAADGKGFYGREDIFQFVSNALNTVQRAPILLIGQRRIGKSSALKQLQLHLGSFYRCIFYDLQACAQVSLDDTLYGLGRAIADGLGIRRPQPEEATAETFPEMLRRSFEALDGHPERLVLLFDEFDVVDQAFAGPEIASKRFIPYLAQLVDQFPAIGCILVVGRRSEELSDGFFSSILRQTVQMRIGRLDRIQTERLVIESFANHLRLSQAAVDEIFRLTAGHPFCAQILCSTIWNRFIADAPAAEIGVQQVDEALEIAVQQWTNGLNWNYDGLQESSQRLFLSALGALSGTHALRKVSFAAIQKELVERRVGIDESKLRLTPHDLQNWDVIAGNSDGYCFTVPMIGVWVQAARPLQDFEGETRLINPRAAKYYDLALDSQQRGSLDEAIQDFRNALEANPVFLEAQLGLAGALRARKEPGDFDAAIEAYERVLELDPSTPPGALLELLVEGVEGSQANAMTAIRRYKRIVELEPAGRNRDRARRVLEQMAQVRYNYGKSERLNEAIQLWTLTDHTEDLAAAQQLLQQVNRANTLCMSVWIVTSLLWLIAIELPKSSLLVKDYTPWLAVILAAFAGQAVSCGTATEYDGKFSFRRMGWVGCIAGVGSGLFAARFLHNQLGLGVVVFFIVSIVNVILNQDSERALPAELTETTTGTGSLSSIRTSVADWLIMMGARLLSSGKKASGRGKKN